MLGHSLLEALLDFDYLAGVTQRGNIRLAFLHIFEADLALGQFAHDDFHQGFDLELVLGGEFDFVFLQDDLRVAAFKIEAIGQFFSGLIDGVLDFHRVDL